MDGVCHRPGSVAAGPAAAPERATPVALPATLARHGVEIKHLFDRHAGRRSILSVPGGTHSHGSSIERLFEGPVPAYRDLDEGREEVP
ncbi:hypothetical protein YIM_13615 [Amycolatopsis sp. YIM 10]|nr:hypothetical protein YIM_13615 [Amycolatopsis sp. YIM 10]